MHSSSAWPTPSTPDVRLAYPAASMEASDGELARVVGVRQAVFPAGADLLVHRLAGLDRTLAERVDVIVRERGEVLIACQRRFSGLPTDVAFDVRAHTGDGEAPVRTFLVPHVFEER